MEKLPGYVPEEWRGPEGRLRWRHATEQLRSFSLVTVQKRDKLNSLSMHSLAHTWAKERQDMELRRAAWLIAASSLSLSCQGDRSYFQFFEALQGHVRACVGHEIRPYMKDVPRMQAAQMLFQLA